MKIYSKYKNTKHKYLLRENASKDDCEYSIFLDDRLTHTVYGHLEYNRKSNYIINVKGLIATVYWEKISHFKVRSAIKVGDESPIILNQKASSPLFKSTTNLAPDIVLKHDIIDGITGKDKVYIEGRYIGWYRIKLDGYDFKGEIESQISDKDRLLYLSIIFADLLGRDYQRRRAVYPGE